MSDVNIFKTQLSKRFKFPDGEDAGKLYLPTNVECPYCHEEIDVIDNREHKEDILSFTECCKCGKTIRIQCLVSLHYYADKKDSIMKMDILY